MWRDGWDMPWQQLLTLVEQLLATPPGQLLVPVDGGYEIRSVPATRIQQALAS